VPAQRVVAAGVGRRSPRRAPRRREGMVTARRTNATRCQPIDGRRGGGGLLLFYPMVVTLVLTLAIVAAVAAVARRRLRRSRLRRAARGRAGARPDLAIAVRSFTEIDDEIGTRWCHCGGYLERAGEGSRDEGGRRFRVVRLRCQECEEPTELFFDTTEVVH
jgi:hypothetical protein